jgi:hypothetical protein
MPVKVHVQKTAAGVEGWNKNRQHWLLPHQVCYDLLRFRDKCVIFLFSNTLCWRAHFRHLGRATAIPQ